MLFKYYKMKFLTYLFIAALFSFVINNVIAVNFHYQSYTIGDNILRCCDNSGDCYETLNGNYTNNIDIDSCFEVNGVKDVNYFNSVMNNIGLIIFLLGILGIICYIAFK